MSNIPATQIIAVVGSMATDDGKHALIKLKAADQSEPVIALPAAALFQAISALATTAAQIQKIDASQNTPVYNATWFEIGEDASSPNVVLTLTFGSGGRLSFSMERSMAEQLRETLNVHLGGQNPRSPGTSLQ